MTSRLVYETIHFLGGRLDVHVDGAAFVPGPHGIPWETDLAEVLDWSVDDGMLRLKGRDGTIEVDVLSGSEGRRPEHSERRPTAIRAMVLAKRTWRRRMAHEVPEGAVFVATGSRRPFRFDDGAGRTVFVAYDVRASWPDVFSWRGGDYAVADFRMTRFDADGRTVWRRDPIFHVDEVLPCGDVLLCFDEIGVGAIDADGATVWCRGVDGRKDWGVEEGVLWTRDFDGAVAAVEVATGASKDAPVR